MGGGALGAASCVRQGVRACNLIATDSGCGTGGHSTGRQAGMTDSPSRSANTHTYTHGHLSPYLRTYT